MKQIDTFILEKLQISRNKTIQPSFTNLEPTNSKVCNTSWQQLICQASVNTLIDVFGEPYFTCRKSNNFHLGIDKTSIEWRLMCTPLDNTEPFLISIYDFDADCADERGELPPYNPDEVYDFHIGVPSKSKVNEKVIDVFNRFIKENEIDGITITKMKFPWMK
jgi:hypothetical protein